VSRHAPGRDAIAGSGLPDAPPGSIEQFTTARHNHLAVGAIKRILRLVTTQSSARLRQGNGTLCKRFEAQGCIFSLELSSNFSA
jgi:hypothetical protein